MSGDMIGQVPVGKVCGLVSDALGKLAGSEGPVFANEFAKCLIKQPCWVPEGTPRRLLELVGTTTARALSSVSGTVSKLIRVNTSDSAPVAIGYVDTVISKWFGKLAIELSADTTLAYHRLARDSRDFPILGELDGHEETTWGEIYSLLLAQPRGPASGDGPLLTNGIANIFYVRDVLGELRAVNVYWRADYGGWDVYASSVAHRRGWDAPDQVFSRPAKAA